MAASNSDHQQQTFVRLAISDGTPKSALWAALVVGTLLTAINHGDAFVSGHLPNLFKVALTYIVPFCVATYGAVSAKRAAPITDRQQFKNQRPTKSTP